MITRYSHVCVHTHLQCDFVSHQEVPSNSQSLEAMLGEVTCSVNETLTNTTQAVPLKVFAHWALLSLAAEIYAAICKQFQTSQLDDAVS